MKKKARRKCVKCGKVKTQDKFYKLGHNTERSKYCKKCEDVIERRYEIYDMRLNSWNGLDEIYC